MLFWLTILVFLAAVALQGLFAYYDGFFWPSQMLRKVSRGLPFFAHGGMWGDVIIISPLVAIIVERYSPQWSFREIVLAILVGLIVSFAMHETYKAGTFPEAHVQYGHLTSAGWVHFGYMAAALAVLGLYYLDAEYTPYMWVVSALLIIHTAIGTHVVLGLAQPDWYSGRPLQSMGTWGAIGGTAVLTLGRTAWLAFGR